MEKKKFNLQLFAQGENNGRGIMSYGKEFKELIEAVFGVEAHFGDFFVGDTIEALDGVANNKTAFTVKTSDIPVVVGTYNKGADVGFGTGTGKSSRFGNRTEVIYKDIDVDYTWGWSFHEGLDRATVNADMDSAVADRLELQAQAKVGQFNVHHGKFISDNASKTIAGGVSVTKDNVGEIFSQLSAHFTNAKVRNGLVKVAKVRSDVYNAIIDSGLATSAKGSSVNIDDNAVLKFKGFYVTEVPADLFQTKEVVYAYVQHCGKAFTGINTVRTIESEDFNGLALQGAGSAGEYVPADNKKAIVKVTVTGA
jgi:hypothetical protein